MKGEDPDLPEMTEHILLCFARSGEGWVGERLQLSKTAQAEILGHLMKVMLPEEAERLLVMLQRTLADAFDIACAQLELRSEAETRSARKGEPGRPPVKLGVKLRDELGEFTKLLTSCDLAKDASVICARVAENEILAKILTLHLEERLHGRFLDPLRSAPEEASALLPALISELRSAICNVVRPGRSEVATNFLARQFITRFKDVHGKLPTRRVSHYGKTGETGPGLEVCRVLAAELHKALPEDMRPSGPAEMAGPYRKALKSASHK